MKNLRAWLSSSSNSLCLDLRSKTDFKLCHLKSCTNIPLSQLALRQAELPPKRLPFAVIEPLEHKGCSSWLIDRGWQIPWVFWEGHLDWKELKWAQNESNQKWLLFQPSPFLEKHINMIEENLPANKRCLDIGCGAGRDLGWLLSRSSGWRASALDALPGAMIRTETLIKNLTVASSLDVLAQAKIMPDGQWKLISNAWWWRTQQQHQDDIIDEITRRSEMSKLEECRENQILLPFNEFYKNIAAAPSPNNKTKFDLILNIRFLSRPFLHDVPNLLKEGGYFLISHFVHDDKHDYKYPKRNSRLELNEVRDLYANRSNELEIVQDVVEESEDGRPINSVLVRRRKK